MSDPRENNIGEKLLCLCCRRVVILNENIKCPEQWKIVGHYECSACARQRLSDFWCLEQTFAVLARFAFLSNV